jgi:hypothetical protein
LRAQHGQVRLRGVHHLQLDAVFARGVQGLFWSEKKGCAEEDRGNPVAETAHITHNQQAVESAGEQGDAAWERGLDVMELIMARKVPRVAAPSRLFRALVIYRRVRPFLASAAHAVARPVENGAYAAKEADEPPEQRAQQNMRQFGLQAGNRYSPQVMRKHPSTTNR